LIGALLATLETPATWPLALATFLVRGGLLLVLLPIVVLPTPVRFGNILAPALSSIAFGSVSPELVLVAIVSAVVVLCWLVLGGWLAAAMEAEGVWMVAGDANGRSLVEPIATARQVAARILAARTAAFIPLVVVLAVGTVRIVLATYLELTSPLDTSAPIVLRVLRATPEVVVAVILAWMVGETIGAIAARRIALAGDRVGPALRGAIATSVRHPLATLTRFWLPTVVLLAVIIPGAIEAGSAWSAVGAVLDGSANVLVILGVVALFVVLWLVGLVLIAVVCAWRAAVWTVAEVAGEGTFGGSGHRRPGDWRSDRSSATL
jgi:hypothetical protein